MRVRRLTVNDLIRQRRPWLERRMPAPSAISPATAGRRPRPQRLVDHGAHVARPTSALTKAMRDARRRHVPQAQGRRRRARRLRGQARCQQPRRGQIISVPTPTAVSVAESQARTRCPHPCRTGSCLWHGTRPLRTHRTCSGRSVSGSGRYRPDTRRTCQRRLRPPSIEHRPCCPCLNYVATALNLLDRVQGGPVMRPPWG